MPMVAFLGQRDMFVLETDQPENWFVFKFLTPFLWTHRLIYSREAH